MRVKITEKLRSYTLKLNANHSHTGKTIIADMIQESQACIDAYTARQKDKTEREDFEGGDSEDGERKQSLNRDEGEERVVGTELGCNVSQVGERAESSHFGIWVVVVLVK